MWTLLVAQAPDAPPMPPDRVREALEHLRDAVDRRHDKIDESLKVLLRELGEHGGRMESLHHRVEIIAARVHEQGNAIQVLKSSYDLNSIGLPKRDYITWMDATRIVVAAVGLSGIVFGAVMWVINLVQGKP